MRTIKVRMAAVLAVMAVLQFAGPSPSIAAERYKPFVLAWRGQADMEARVSETRKALEGAGYEIVAEFNPYDKDAYVDEVRILVFTSSGLKRVAAMTEYGGFAAAQRVAITKSGDDIQVAYVNPVYLTYAYRLDKSMLKEAVAIMRALGRIETFGSKKGLTERKLKKYHYTFGMEYFDDVYELAGFGSHAEALSAVRKSLAKNDAGVRELYRIDIPGKDVSVIGVSRKSVSEDTRHMDDQWIMTNVDFNELKGVAYLPYQVMVTGGRVVALHMRFRMAVHFPDLKMMGENSFMNLMPSPAAIEKALTQGVGGSAGSDVQAAN